ncbi:MAG TPA: glycosyltransferase [Stellaceae bacterium]|nr:glycosyltransferase [Stellaceae bacterium]
MPDGIGPRPTGESGASACPPLSVIINTDGRAAILGNTIESLRYLRYPALELVVVPGPTADGTRELLDAHWRGEIKIGACPTRNIAQSRNIGIEIASGEVIAFIDDDEVPEPEWLEDLVPLLQDPAVAVAGGWLHDHTGKGYESRFETVDRLGSRSWERAAPEFNFPLSFTVPHLNINSAFRRSALIDVGGFDEEFEYLFDETDLMCRFVDRGWHIVQTDRGIVHHKYLPSSVRNEQRILTSWYSVIKNKTYFALLHGARFVPFDRILANVAEFVAGNRNDIRGWIEQGLLPPDTDKRFEREAEAAVRDGIARALSGRRRLGDPARLAGDPTGFVRFHTHLPAARQRCFVLLSDAHPPQAVDDVGRPVRALACALAAEGHQVHVLTRGAGHDRVDFEDRIWVHRCVMRDFPAPGGMPVPADVWNYSMTMLAEAEEIGRRRPIAAIHAPLSRAEAIAFVDREWPLVTSLDPEPPSAAAPEAGRIVLTGSAGIAAPGAAAVAAVEAAYRVALDRDRLAVLPDGGTAREIAFLIDLAERRGRSAAAPGRR